MGDEGGAAADSGVPTGLGNFKGVMLCNRPDFVGDGRLKDPTELKPFYSSVAPGALEPLGMIHKCDLDPQAERRVEPEAIKKHREWIAELQENLQKSKKEKQKKEKEKTVDFLLKREQFADQRQAVREVLDQAQSKGTTKQSPDLINQLRDAIAIGEKTIKKKKEKPAWALTEEEQKKKEKDDAEDLCSFAAALDFDEYIDDLEFRTALTALCDRAGVLSRIQQKFEKELEVELDKDVTQEGLEEDLVSVAVSGVSRSVSERGGNAGTQLQQKRAIKAVSDVTTDSSCTSTESSIHSTAFDSSVKGAESSAKDAGDGGDSEVSVSSRQQAKEVLKENKDIRDVHSKESMRLIIEKAERMAKALEAMRDQPGNLNPKIVTSKDSCSKIFDPSKIAYLYRSPAI